MPAPYSENAHVGIAGVQVYTIGIDYLKASYLSVTVTPVAGPEETATFDVINDGLEVEILTPTILGGEEILIARHTSLEARLVDWESPGALLEESMDLSDDQFFHLIQELSDALAGLTIIVEETNLPPGGAAGDVLTKASAIDYDVFWTAPAGGPGGGIAGGLNVGGGAEVFRDVVGPALAFRTLVAGAGASVTEVGDTIEFALSAPSGGIINTGSNVSTDGVGVFDGVVGDALTFRGIAAPVIGGLAVALDDGQNDIDISIATNGVTTIKILDGAVTFAKIQDMSAEHLLGRFGPGTGDVQELQASDLTLAAGATVADRLLLFTAAGLLRQISPADVLPPGSVGNPDLSDMPGNSFKGNVSGSAAAPQDCIISSVGTNISPSLSDYVLGWTVSGTWQKVPLSQLPTAGVTASFVTIAPTSGTNAVADQIADTLFLAGNAQLTISGNSLTDTISFIIPVGTIFNQFLGSMAPNTLKGRAAGTGDPVDLVRTSFPSGVPGGGEVLGWLGDTLTRFAVGDIGGGGGGTITGASNVNVGGVGVWFDLSGTTLRFKGVAELLGGGLQVIDNVPNRQIDIGIVNGGVTNAMLANMPANTLKGRAEGSTGPPIDLNFSSLTSESTPQTSDRLIGWETGGGLLRYFTIANIRDILDISFPQLPDVAAFTLLGRNASLTGDLATFNLPGLPLQSPPFGAEQIFGCLAGGDFRRFNVSDFTSGGATLADAKWAEFWSTPHVRDFLNTSVEPTLGLTDGDAWVLPASPSGVSWGGQGNKIALWNNGWLFRPFAGGMEVHVARASIHRFKGLRLRYNADENVWHPSEDARIDTLHWTGKYSREFPTSFIVRRTITFSSPGGVTSIPQPHFIAGVQTGDCSTHAKGSVTVGGITFAVPCNVTGNQIEVRLDATNVTINSTANMANFYQFCIDIDAAVTTLPVGIGT